MPPKRKAEEEYTRKGKKLRPRHESGEGVASRPPPKGKPNRGNTRGRGRGRGGRGRGGRGVSGVSPGRSPPSEDRMVTDSSDNNVVNPSLGEEHVAAGTGSVSANVASVLPASSALSVNKRPMTRSYAQVLASTPAAAPPAKPSVRPPPKAPAPPAKPSVRPAPKAPAPPAKPSVRPPPKAPAPPAKPSVRPAPKAPAPPAKPSLPPPAAPRAPAPPAVVPAPPPASMAVAQPSRPSPHRQPSPATLRLRAMYPDSAWNPALTRSIQKCRSLEKNYARDAKEYARAARLQDQVAPPSSPVPNGNSPKPSKPVEWWKKHEHRALREVLLRNGTPTDSDKGKGKGRSEEEEEKEPKIKVEEEDIKLKFDNEEEEEEEEEKKKKPNIVVKKKEEPEREVNGDEEAEDGDDGDDGDDDGADVEDGTEEEDDADNDDREIEEDVAVVKKHQNEEDDTDDDHDYRGGRKAVKNHLKYAQDQGGCEAMERFGRSHPPSYASDNEDEDLRDDQFFAEPGTTAYKTRLNQMLEDKRYRCLSSKEVPPLPAPPIPERHGLILSGVSPPASPPPPPEESESSGSDFAKTTALAKQRRAHRFHRKPSVTEEDDNEEDQQLAREVVASSPAQNHRTSIVPSRISDRQTNLLLPGSPCHLKPAVPIPKHPVGISDSQTRLLRGIEIGWEVDRAPGKNPTQGAQKGEAACTQDLQPEHQHPRGQCAAAAEHQHPRADIPQPPEQLLPDAVGPAQTEHQHPTKPEHQHPTKPEHQHPTKPEHQHPNEVTQQQPKEKKKNVSKGTKGQEFDKQPEEDNSLLDDVLELLQGVPEKSRHGRPSRAAIDRAHQIAKNYLDECKEAADEFDLSVTTIHKLVKIFVRHTPGSNLWNSFQLVLSRKDKRRGETRREFNRRARAEYRRRTDPQKNTPEEIEAFEDEIEEAMIETAQEPELLRNAFTLMQSTIDELQEACTRISGLNPLIGTFAVVTYAGPDQAARQLSGAITGSDIGQQVLDEGAEHIQVVVDSLGDLHRHYVNMETLRIRGLVPTADSEQRASHDKVPGKRSKKDSKKSLCKIVEETAEDESREIRYTLQIDILRHQGTKTAHEARKVVTHDLRCLCGVYWDVPKKSISWKTICESLADLELRMVWPLEKFRQYPSQYIDVMSFGLSEWRALQEALNSRSLRIERWSEEERGWVHGTRQRADVPVVVGLAGAVLLTYGETIVGGNASKTSRKKSNKGKGAAPVDNEDEHDQHASVLPPNIAPPSQPIEAPPLTSVEEIQQQIVRLQGLLNQEKQRTENQVPQVFDHYKFVTPTRKPDPDDPYPIPPVRVVTRPQFPAPPAHALPAIEKKEPLYSIDTAAYHRAMTQPYRGELSGGSKPKFLTMQQGKGTGISPTTFYQTAPTPPSARVLQRHLPGSHPAMRVVPQHAACTRAEQQRRAACELPTSQQAPRPAAPLAPILERFNQQRYLRNTTAGPSCEVFLDEKKGRIVHEEMDMD